MAREAAKIAREANLIDPGGELLQGYEAGLRSLMVALGFVIGFICGLAANFYFQLKRDLLDS